MKKRLVSILLSLAMIATMTASFTAISFADTESAQVQAEEHNIMLGAGLGENDMSSLLNALGADNINSLLNMFGDTGTSDLTALFGEGNLGDLTALFEGGNLGDLTGMFGETDIKDILSMFGITDADNLMSKFHITDLDDFISTFNITDLNDLINKLNIGDVEELVDSNDISAIKTLAKAAIDSVAGTSTDTAVQDLVTKGHAAVDAATTKEAVIAASGEYVNLINKAIIESTKLFQNKLVAKTNGSIKVSFEAPALEGVVGYEIQRATNEAFTKNLKTYNNKKTVRNNTKQLKKGRRYFYRVRAKVQLADDTTTYYTAWSNTRFVKCKKTR